MKKSLFLLTLISLLATSCNVVQMLTQAKTDVPDSFFDGHKGEPESIIFMACDKGNGERLCAFFTKDHSVIELHSSAQASSTGTSEFALYKGNVIFTGWSATDNLYRYDFNTGNSALVDSGNAKGFTLFDQHFYYISSNGNTLKAMSNSGFLPLALSGGSVTYANSFWLKAFYANNTGKLILCKISGNDNLQEVVVDDSSNPSAVTISLIDPAGASNDVICGPGNPLEYEGHFLYGDTAGKIIDYDVITDLYSEWFEGSTAASVDVNNDGVFFYSGDSSGSTKLFKYEIGVDTNGTQVMPDNFQPSNLLNVFASPSGETLFINKDGNNVDQLYREAGGNAYALTNFTSDGSNILHYTIGSKGFYIIRSDGMYLMHFDGNISLIPGLTIYNKGFASFSEDKLYDN